MSALHNCPLVNSRYAFPTVSLYGRAPLVEKSKKNSILYSRFNDILIAKGKKINEISTTQNQKNNPLHGKTLESILLELVDKVGWIEMNRRVKINCFYSHPSIKSSLKFLRKEAWARIQVEKMYLDLIINSKLINKD